MNDSDPRPMPPEVQRAYQSPLDLRMLLESSPFEGSVMEICDKLLDELIEKYGSVEIPHGKGFMPIRRRVEKISKDAWKSIELMASFHEYGRRATVLPLLASVMQPYWARWWDRFVFSDADSVAEWWRVSRMVLGDRQNIWLAAQCIRSSVDRVDKDQREAAVDVCDSAEAYAAHPSEDSYAAMNASHDRAYALSRSLDYTYSRRADSGGINARILYASVQARYGSMGSVLTNLAHGSSAIYKKMEKLIRTQISPELVDTTAEDQQ